MEKHRYINDLHQVCVFFLVLFLKLGTPPTRIQKYKQKEDSFSSSFVVDFISRARACKQKKTSIIVDQHLNNN